MDKNENGYPMPNTPGGNVGGVTDDSGNGGCGCGCGNGSNGGNGNNGGIVGGVTNHTCGGKGNCLDEMPLAYCYAPDQRFQMLYSANEALHHGTLFEELYKPREVYGRE